MIVFCVETCVTDQINDSEIQMNGYNLIRCDSISRHTGGVVAYIQQNLKFEVIYHKVFERNMWALAVKIKNKQIDGIYSALYHSPNSSHTDFLNYLEEMLIETIDVSKLNIVMGDFNINANESSNESNRLIRTCETYSLKQRVEFETRITNTSRTKIDLVFTNMDKVSCIQLESEKISDHETIAINIKSKGEKIKKVERVIRCWDDYSKENLLSALQNVNWVNWRESGIDDKVAILGDTLVNVVNNLTYEKQIEIKIMNKWYDRELSTMNKEKYRLYKLAQVNVYYSEDYNNIRKEYKRLIKTKKINYLQNEIDESRHDQRKMWKCLKKIMKTEDPVTQYSEIKFDGAVCDNKEEIAVKFNNYFVESIIQLQMEIEPIQWVPQNRRRRIQEGTRFKFEILSVDEIGAIMESLGNKIGGKKLLSYGVVKDSAAITAYFYMDIVNESLQTGRIPDSWKLSTVIPIPKINKTTKAEEFRPINTLPVDEKILETAVKRQLTKYIEENELLMEAQSGFREAHSCETALNLILETWKTELDKGNVIVAVFLDLKRAFETIDRNILIMKLEAMGIEGTELEWFKNYLSGRKQQTKFSETMSGQRSVEIGVPQGSCLAPLLFILYINDIEDALKHMLARLFADDALTAYADKNIDRALERVNEDLENLYKWLCSNKLKTNINKTKYMVITNGQFIENNHPRLSINNEELERVSSIKYLGVQIDDKLRFSEHVNYIEKKIAKKVGFMYRTCSRLRRDYKVTVYRTIVEPHFIYCASLLYLCTIADKEKLQKLQNRAMRCILRRPRDYSVKRMLDELGWLSVKQAIEYYSLILIFKIKRNLLPTYLSVNLRCNRDVHGRELRNKDDFRLPYRNKSTSQNSLFYKGVKLFNESTTEMKRCINLSEFKKLCFEFTRSRPIKESTINM